MGHVLQHESRQFLESESAAETMAPAALWAGGSDWLRSVVTIQLFTQPLEVRIKRYKPARSLEKGASAGLV